MLNSGPVSCLPLSNGVRRWGWGSENEEKWGLAVVGFPEGQLGEELFPRLGETLVLPRYQFGMERTLQIYHRKPLPIYDCGAVFTPQGHRTETR